MVGSRRMLVGTVLAVAMVTSLPAVAAPPAQSGPVERMDGTANFFYWDDGVMVIVGESVAHVCEDIGSPADAMKVTTGNGGGQFGLKGNVPVVVFADPRFDSSDPFIGFVFLFEVCELGADYDVIATGDDLRVRVRETIAPDGTVHSENSIVGKVETTDGKTAHVTTHASVWFNGPELIKLNPFFVKYTG